MRGLSVGLHEYAQLSCEAHDVARGIKVLLGMLEQDVMDGSFQDDNGGPMPQLLRSQDAAILMRLCIASSELLSERAQRGFDLVNAIVEKKGGAQ